MEYQTIDEIKRANKALGHHFFSPDMMRFFSSRTLNGVIGGRYFISSELVLWQPPRAYMVRECIDGACHSAEHGDGGAPITYPTAAQARKAAHRLAAATRDALTAPDAGETHV